MSRAGREGIVGEDGEPGEMLYGPTRRLDASGASTTEEVVGVGGGVGGPDPEVKGFKIDAGKPRYDLIPPEVMHGMAAVFTAGLAKYPDRNWERGLEWCRIFAALQRHSWAWLAGETNDPETGLPHTWHMAACCAMLAATEVRGVGTDDRPQR
jgi:hypothetical protein